MLTCKYRYLVHVCWTTCMLNIDLSPQIIFDPSYKPFIFIYRSLSVNNNEVLPLIKNVQCILRKQNQFLTFGWWILESSGNYEYFVWFLTHLSWKLQWAFLIACRPSSVCLSVRPSVHLSVCLYVCLSTFPIFDFLSRTTGQILTREIIMK